MNASEYHQLQAERATLDDLLERLPSQNVIERTGLEFRRKEVEGALPSPPEKENIHEEVREITGRIIGVLPLRRTFEFLEDETGELISGRIDHAIEDAAEINQFLNRSLKIRVYSKRVGTASPRYVLLEYDI